MMARILSDVLLSAMTNLGIDVSATRRVVIDIQTGHAPVIHIEQFGDDRLLSVVRALNGVEIKREGD